MFNKIYYAHDTIKMVRKVLRYRYLFTSLLKRIPSSSYILLRRCYAISNRFNNRIFLYSSGHIYLYGDLNEVFEVFFFFTYPVGYVTGQTCANINISISHSLKKISTFSLSNHGHILRTITP